MTFLDVEGKCGKGNAFQTRMAPKVQKVNEAFRYF